RRKPAKEPSGPRAERLRQEDLAVAAGFMTEALIRSTQSPSIGSRAMRFPGGSQTQVLAETSETGGGDIGGGGDGGDSGSTTTTTTTTISYGDTSSTTTATAGRALPLTVPYRHARITWTEPSNKNNGSSKHGSGCSSGAGGSG
ncbi:unnamed protein product, partial [Ectocarpus fasciculatus]